MHLLESKNGSTHAMTSSSSNAKINELRLVLGQHRIGSDAWKQAWEEHASMARTQGYPWIFNLKNMRLIGSDGSTFDGDLTNGPDRKKLLSVLQESLKRWIQEKNLYPFRSNLVG